MTRRIVLLALGLAQLGFIPAHAAGCAATAPPVTRVQEAFARDGDVRIVARITEKTTLCDDGSTQTETNSWLNFENPWAGCGTPATITFTDTGAHAVSSGYCSGDITWVYTGDPPEVNSPYVDVVGDVAGLPRRPSAATGVRHKATVTDGHYIFITTPWTFSDPAASTVSGVWPLQECLVLVCV